MNVGQPVIMQAANSEAQELTEDVMDDADVAGVTFDVYAKEDIVSADGLGTVYHKAGDKVATIVTNDKGIARIDDLPLGKYYLVETKTLDGFVLDDTPIDADIIKGLGFGESLVMLILTALLAIIIIICGFFIIYTVYFRFLKILIIVPLGAIACSTMAGNRMVSHTMATYCKYFLSCVFEAVTMALAIVVCNAFINAGLPAFTGSYADWAQTLIYLCEMTFTIAMTVGGVKGAQTLTSKAFGL